MATRDEQVEMQTQPVAEWLAELHERAGDPIDPARLAFRCPQCEHVATGQDFLDVGPAHPARQGDPLMAKGEISDAMHRMRQRQKAAGINTTGEPGSAVSEETFRLIFSGLDLDIEETQRAKEGNEEAARTALEEGEDPGFVAAGMFLDGLGIGLLIGEARAKREASR